MFDLGPAAQEMRRVLVGVREDQLGDRTPCEDWTVADLLAHVHQFTTVFTNNARKLPKDMPHDLPDDWSSRLPQQVDDLAEAWRDDAAWTGRVSAGGVDMDAEDNAVVALEELVLHGWDLARATGQDFHASEISLDHVDRFFEVFAEPIASGNGPHGPSLAAPEDADRLDRTLARAGRDPGWAPTP
jgi:uncharacterized protein (TIGR03086 family)